MLLEEYHRNPIPKSHSRLRISFYICSAMFSGVLFIALSCLNEDCYDVAFFYFLHVYVSLVIGFSKSVQEYLQGNPLWLQYVKVPLVTLGYESSYDVFVKAHGGGLSGQAQAISLGIARALLKVNANHRAPLKKEGLLTRDSRVVERKKVGLKKARKAPQYSKR